MKSLWDMNMKQLFPKGELLPAATVTLPGEGCTSETLLRRFQGRMPEPYAELPSGENQGGCLCHELQMSTPPGGKDR